MCIYLNRIFEEIFEDIILAYSGIYLLMMNEVISNFYLYPLISPYSF